MFQTLSTQSAHDGSATGVSRLPLQRRETVEHPFGTIKMWMGATHFLMKRLKNVRTEMALHVLAYNLKRVMSIMGIGPLMAAIRAQAIPA